MERETSADEMDIYDDGWRIASCVLYTSVFAVS